MDEQTLIHSAQCGNLEAFNQLVLVYQDNIFNTALWMLGDNDLAADLVLAGVAVRYAVEVTWGHPPTRILDVARERTSDLIVMGTQGASPSVSWISLIQKIMSCFSSEFIPAQGSSKSRVRAQGQGSSEFHLLLNAIGQSADKLVSHGLQVEQIYDLFHLPIIWYIFRRL
jgi:hypothetical protein